jgi:hypothetical protein
MNSYLIIRIPFELGLAVVYQVNGTRRQAISKMVVLFLKETGNFKGNRRFLYQLEKAGYKMDAKNGIVYNGDGDEWLLYPSTKIQEVSDVKTQNKGSKTR